MNVERDVVIVGGGVAGLTCAHRLRQSGLSVAVVEAADRVGGRTFTARANDGTLVDLGGQWLGPGQDRAIALADELGIELFRTHHRGRGVMSLGGSRRKHPHDLPIAFPLVALDFFQAALRLQALALRVDRARPWQARRAAQLDQTTLDEWLERVLHTSGARTMFEVTSGLTLGGDARDVSLLFAAQHIRASGGLLRLLSIDRGAQRLRFAGGAQSLTLEMAELMRDDVFLSSPVVRVEQDETGVTIFTESRTFGGERAVLAMSPWDRQSIDFHPPLPPAESEYAQRTSAFGAIKVQLVYRRPFWRDAGLSGHGFSDQRPAPVIADCSPPDGSSGVLTTFVAARSTESPLSPTEEQVNDPAIRRESVLRCAEQLFGPQALEPVDYIEQNWSHEPFVAGCIPTVTPGVTTEVAPCLSSRHGNVLWAGTEQSHVWNAYIDGAVRSGEHAAATIVSELRLSSNA